jgi:hypothetical protein
MPYSTGSLLHRGKAPSRQVNDPTQLYQFASLLLDFPSFSTVTLALARFQFFDLSKLLLCAQVIKQQIFTCSTPTISARFLAAKLPELSATSSTLEGPGLTAAVVVSLGAIPSACNTSGAQHEMFIEEQ